MEWLRLYTEARTDRKLQSLPDDQFRVWFNLLCFMGEQPERGLVTGYDRELLAVEVASGDTELLNATLERLVKLRIVTCDGDDVRLINFEKRQYDKPSDQPARVTERVRRHRAKQETPMKRDVTPCNALDTDTDTDTESERGSTPPTPPASPDKPAPDRNEPFELLVGLCEITGTDIADLSESTKRRQCSKAKQLLAAGMAGQEQLRCAGYLKSQEWRTSGIDFFVIERERSAWELAGKPATAQSRASPGNGRGGPASKAAHIQRQQEYFIAVGRGEIDP